MVIAICFGSLILTNLLIALIILYDILCGVLVILLMIIDIWKIQGNLSTSYQPRPGTYFMIKYNVASR